MKKPRPRIRDAAVFEMGVNSANPIRSTIDGVSAAVLPAIVLSNRTAIREVILWFICGYLWALGATCGLMNPDELEVRLGGRSA